MTTPILIELAYPLLDSINKTSKSHRARSSSSFTLTSFRDASYKNISNIINLIEEIGVAPDYYALSSLILYSHHNPQKNDNLLADIKEKLSIEALYPLCYSLVQVAMQNSAGLNPFSTTTVHQIIEQIKPFPEKIPNPFFQTFLMNVVGKKLKVIPEIENKYFTSNNKEFWSNIVNTIQEKRDIASHLDSVISVEPNNNTSSSPNKI